MVRGLTRMRLGVMAGILSAACLCGPAGAVEKPKIEGIALPDLSAEAVAALRREKRVALVIGNQTYTVPSFHLTKTRKDAEAMAALLRYLGFEVILVKDAGKKEMATALDTFETRLAAGVDIGLFFYSGHGQQNDAGRGFVLPTDVPQRLGDAQLQEHALAVDYIRNIMVMNGKARLNVLVLDACRDNPGVKGTKGGAKGLGSPPTAVVGQSSGGTVIAYATQSGSVSYEGHERDLYSVYTGELLKTLAAPGVEIQQAFALATMAVGQATRGAQQPNYVAGVYDHFRLVPEIAPAPRREEPQQVAVVTPPPAAPAPVQPPAVTPVVGVFFPPGKVFKDCDKCPEMVVVPKGEFLMGSPDNEPITLRGADENERPQHRVTIGSDFAVGKFEVTFAEWDACVAGGGCNGYKPSDEGWGRGRYPVINVSWTDAQTYVAWLKQQTGQPYRLLTEAEWEYAARAGTTTPFSTGPTIGANQANFDGTATYNGSARGPYRQRTVKVGTFRPNAFGLYDMHGNVWELVEDCPVRYIGSPGTGTAYTASECDNRIIRGGSWANLPEFLRSAYRSWTTPSERSNFKGFRVAKAF